MEYSPTREGEVLSVMAIEHHIVTLIGGGGTHYRARYVAAEDWSEVEPLRPADILVVIHSNPDGKSAVVTHATTGDRDGDQYHLIFDVAERMIHPAFLLYCCKTWRMGTPITHCSYARYLRRTAPMHEPTQEMIVSELRRRVRLSIYGGLDAGAWATVRVNDPSGNSADERQWFSCL